MNLLLVALVLTTASPEYRQPSVGRPWVLPLDASGGSPPYQWEVVEGALPPGLNLVDLSTVMLGSPSRPGLFGAPAVAGSWPILLRVTDSEGTVEEKAMEITVSPLTLRETQVLIQSGEQWEWKPEATEGAAPFRYELAAGAFLPLGITVTAEGTFRGTVLIPGTYEVPIEVRDAGENLLRTTLTLSTYGEESVLPAIALRIGRTETEAMVELPPLPEGVSIEIAWGDGAREIYGAEALLHTYEAGAERTIEVTVTHNETGQQVRAVYPLI
jgi:hypothetical protein